MKLGVILAKYAEKEGQWIWPIIQTLMLALKANHEIILFSLNYPETDQPYSLGGITVIPLWQESPSHQARIKTIIGQHQETPFDMLHAFDSLESGEIAVEVGYQLGLPVIITPQAFEVTYNRNLNYGISPNSAEGERIRQTINSAASLIAPSRYMANYVRAELDDPNKTPIAIIPYGVDLNHFFPPLPELDFRPRAFLYVGNLEPIDNVANLLELTTTLRNSTLDIVGDGSQRDFLELYAKELGIEGRVVFHGYVSYDRLPAFYQEARFLITTAYHSAFYMPAIEALACGAGVIGSGIGILPEIGQNILPGDINKFQRMIMKRSRSNALRMRMRSRLLAEHEFSIENTAEKLTALYESLI